MENTIFNLKLIKTTDKCPCPKCTNPTSSELHSCPYQCEINDDCTDHCSCCEDCAHECAMDV